MLRRSGFPLHTFALKEWKQTMARSDIAKVNVSGASSIVDRVEGWGHDDSSDSNREDNGTWTGASITATDASKESTATRVARNLKARKTFKEASDPAIVDRTVGYGSAFDPTAGAGGYVDDLEDETPVSLPDAADYANGVFFDEAGDAEAGTGSNTASSTTDTDALASGRTSVALPTSDLTPDAYERVETVGSIVDRTDGWGHSDASTADREDA
jgi:hypothetical protein